MLSCVRYRTRLGTYLDGEFSLRESEAIAAHLAKCAACRTALQEIRRLGPALLTLDTSAPPSNLTSRILAEARARRQAGKARLKTHRPRYESPVPRAWALKSATAAALIIGLTMGAYMGWTTYRDGRSAQSWTVKAGNERVEEPLYALDVLSGAPEGSIEAATLALLEDGR